MGELTENPKIAGVNVTRGIATTGGTLENYMKMLDIFYKDSQEKIKEIRCCIDTDDPALFVIYIHALKSAAANIGAGHIAREAGMLEKTAREGKLQAIPSDVTKLLEHLEELMSDINAVLIKANEYKQRAPADMEVLIDELYRLKEAINMFDAAIIKKSTDELQKYTHSTDIGERIQNLLQYVFIGDDDKAQSLITMIILDNQ